MSGHVQTNFGRLGPVAKTGSPNRPPVRRPADSHHPIPWDPKRRLTGGKTGTDQDGDDEPGASGGWWRAAHCDGSGLVRGIVTFSFTTCHAYLCNKTYNVDTVFPVLALSTDGLVPLHLPWHADETHQHAVMSPGTAARCCTRCL